MHISAKPFLCYNFSRVVCDLLEAISRWFDKRILDHQQTILDQFLLITTTEDLGNPVVLGNIDVRYQRQLSFENREQMEKYRDDKQKELLGKMMIELRTNKGYFIDEEAQKVPN